MQFNSAVLFFTAISFFGASLAAPTAIETRQLSSTRNDLSGACKDVTVIYARGTTELGNVGSIAGPPFFSALALKIGSSRVAVQGVDYPGMLSYDLLSDDINAKCAFVWIQRM